MGRGSVVIFTASGSAYIPFLQQAFSTVGLAPAIGCSARRWAARVVAAPVEQGDYAKDKPLQLGQSMRDTWSIDNMITGPLDYESKRCRNSTRAKPQSGGLGIS